MPCRDYYDDHPEAYYGPQLKNKDEEIERLKKQVSFAESALCATLKGFEAVLNHATQIDYVDPLEHIPLSEAGITQKELQDWRAKHAALDKKHKEAEKVKLVKKALAKLSAEERAALGLK
jgi:hypothetical protein